MPGGNPGALRLALRLGEAAALGTMPGRPETTPAKGLCVLWDLAARGIRFAALLEPGNDDPAAAHTAGVDAVRRNRSGPETV